LKRLFLFLRFAHAHSFVADGAIFGGACAYAVARSGGAVEYLVVSDNHTFMISRHDGDIPVEDTPLGLYYDDTRHLSALQVRLDGQPLELLSSNDEHVYHALFLLTNSASAKRGRRH
jgi:hypothetical protein